MPHSQSEIIINSTTTLQKLIIHVPDDLFILYIIARDGTVFTPAFIHEAIKINPINFTEHGPANLKAAYTIFYRLIERKMVKQGFTRKNKFRTLITLRGRIYRISGHYTFGIWTFLLGIVIGFGSQQINCNQGNRKVNSPIPTSIEVNSRPMQDTVYQKSYPIPSDSLKDRTDTTKKDTASAKPPLKPKQQ